MLLLAAILGLAVMTGINLRVGRSILYPPALFCAVWSTLLAALLLCGDKFFPVSAQALMIYLAGAAAFSIGGALRGVSGGLVPAPRRGARSNESRILRRWLVLMCAALVVCFPFYWEYLKAIAATVRMADFWWAMRAGTIAQGELSGAKDASALFYDNLAILAIFAALTAVAHQGENRIRRWHAVALITLGLAYNLATASRSGGMLLVVAAVGITLIRGRSFRFRTVLILTLGFCIVFVPAAVLMKKGGDPNGGFLDNVVSISDMVILYAVGPIVAFDMYLQSPASVDATWTIYRVYLQTMNRLGANVTVPSLHTGYVMVAPGKFTNVYTFYFSYFPSFGILGVVILTAVIGYGLAALYSSARTGRRTAVFFYGIGFYQICVTGFNEGFLLGANMWLKAALYCFFLYRILPLMRRRESSNWIGGPFALEGRPTRHCK